MPQQIGVLELAPAAGLLAGLAVAALGIAAAAGLVLLMTGASRAMPGSATRSPRD